MFTGIIEAVGLVKSIENRGDSARIEITTADLPENDLKIGDSVSINGVCLTVTTRSNSTFSADIGAETLKVTALRKISVGQPVNVERAMQMGQRFGGHVVQGHIDAVGKVLNINKIANGVEVNIEFSDKFAKYIVKRGSVAINGVSLTVTDCTKNQFRVFLIPHTLESTVFKFMTAGSEVNLEFDLMGKYVEKMMASNNDEKKVDSKITENFLRENGF